jgi:hypothetical protein
MQAVSPPSRPVKHPFHRARIAMSGTFSRLGLFRIRWPGRRPGATQALRDDCPVLWDARCSMRCGNPARSCRVLTEWLKSRGDQPADYEWLCTRLLNWEDGRVIAQLTEARITRLLALRRSTEALTVLAQRLSANPRFRPSSAADTLSLAQVAARGGAPRISRILLSDFSARFAGDPRVSVSEALKRRLTQQTPVGLRA